MNSRTRRSKPRFQPLPGRHGLLVGVLLSHLLAPVCCADDFARRYADREAIERVYYQHRTGTKPPFEQTLPPAALERLVRREMQEAERLRKVYGVELTPAMIEAEVNRINTTTRAPDMLAEIKTALGNDPSRFASSFAKPILVSTLLRERFANDDTRHAPIRRQCETLRARLLAARTQGAAACQLLGQLKQPDSNAVTEVTWPFMPRLAETNAPGVDELEARQRFGPDARVISPPSPTGPEREFYFGDLPPQLQEVLRAQLRKAGDVSAVIETPDAFLLCLAMARTEKSLSVAYLSVPKRNYEEWLQAADPDQP